MADNTNFPHISPFVPDSDPTSVAQRWKRWSDRFDNLIIAMNITNNDRKIALLLHLAGEAVYDIYQGLVVPEGADADPNVDTCTSTPNELSTRILIRNEIRSSRYIRSVKQLNSKTSHWTRATPDFELYSQELRLRQRRCRDQVARHPNL